MSDLDGRGGAAGEGSSGRGDRPLSAGEVEAASSTASAAGRGETVSSKAVPRPSDFRLARPGPSSSILKSLARKLVERILSWRIGPLERSVEDKLYEEASRRHELFRRLVERIENLERQAVSARLSQFEARLRAVEDGLQALQACCGDSEPRSGQPPVSSVTTLSTAGPGPGVRAPSDFDFGLRFRGDDRALRERARWYVGLMPPDGLLIDLGCGRGELMSAWLEGEGGRAGGREALGVDTDPVALRHCRSRGLEVEACDAARFLAGRGDASCSVVAALHVLEHMDAGDVFPLLLHARRCLRDGGVFVAELPNPCSLSGLSSFFTDPGHRWPLAPQALAFLLESAGFRRIETVFLDPVPDSERCLRLPSPSRREDADSWEILRTSLERLDAKVFGCLSYCCIARVDGIADRRAMSRLQQDGDNAGGSVGPGRCIGRRSSSAGREGGRHDPGNDGLRE